MKAKGLEVTRNTRELKWLKRDTQEEEAEVEEVYKALIKNRFLFINKKNGMINLIKIN